MVFWFWCLVGFYGTSSQYRSHSDKDTEDIRRRIKVAWSTCWYEWEVMAYVWFILVACEYRLPPWSWFDIPRLRRLYSNPGSNAGFTGPMETGNAFKVNTWFKNDEKSLTTQKQAHDLGEGTNKIHPMKTYMCISIQQDITSTIFARFKLYDTETGRMFAPNVPLSMWNGENGREEVHNPKNHYTKGTGEVNLTRCLR